MPKRYFKYYLTAITVISFIACSEKDTLNGEGMLHLKVGVTDQVKVTTRSMTVNYRILYNATVQSASLMKREPSAGTKE